MYPQNIQVILSHHGEDLSYLKVLNEEGVIYTVQSTKFGEVPSYAKNVTNVKINKGYDGHKYNLFIRDNYEKIKNSPEDSYYLFLHAHYESPHQFKSITQIIFEAPSLLKKMQQNKLIYFSVNRPDWLKTFLHINKSKRRHC